MTIETIRVSMGTKGQKGDSGYLSVFRVFANTGARDTYFTANPTRKTTGIVIAVGSVFQEWSGSAWVNVPLAVLNIPTNGVVAANDPAWGWVDGSDNTAAVQLALDTLPGGSVLYIPGGETFTAELSNSGKPFHIFSDGSVTFSGCNGFAITHDGSALSTFTLRDMSIETLNEGLYTGVDFVGTERSGYKIPRLRMRNVNVSGAGLSGDRQWLVGISLESADQAELISVGVKGTENSFINGFVPATTGIVINNSSNVDIDVQIYRVKTGAVITGQSEGTNWNRSEIVAVDVGIKATGLVRPSNNHNFNMVHIAANSVGIKIEACTDSTVSLGHNFGKMFILKRVDSGQQVGGNANYIAMDLCVKNSTFSGLSTRSSDTTVDYLSQGDKAIVFRTGSINNVGSSISLYNPGVGIEYENNAIDNDISFSVVNDTSYDMTPRISYNSGRNFGRYIYDNGVPASYIANGNAFDWETAGGRAFRVGNGATDTDCYITAFAGAATAGAATAELRVQSESGDTTNGDLYLNTLGFGVVRFGSRTSTTDVPITGYITIKDQGGTTRKLAIID